MTTSKTDRVTTSSRALEDEWNDRERELLARIRAARSQRAVPQDVQQRLLARLRAPVPQRTTPSTPLPTLGQLGHAVPGSHRELWVAAPLAAIFLVLLAVRTLGWAEPLGAWLNITEEASRDGAEPLARLPLFRDVAIALQPGTTQGRDLLGARAFRDGGKDWQVRNWDLRGDPEVLASYDLSGGTLCVEPQNGVPVLGAWPWRPSPKEPSRGHTGAEPLRTARADSGVSLRGGQAYRLTLSAWATQPVKSRLLVAVGHAAPPYSAASGAQVQLETKPRVFGVDFVADFDDPNVGVAFLASATPAEAPSGQASRICVRDFHLTRLP